MNSLGEAGRLGECSPRTENVVGHVYVLPVDVAYRYQTASALAGAELLLATSGGVTEAGPALHPVITTARLAENSGFSPERTVASLTRLASAGKVGFDLTVICPEYPISGCGVPARRLTRKILRPPARRIFRVNRPGPRAVPPLRPPPGPDAELRTNGHLAGCVRPSGERITPSGGGGGRAAGIR